MKSKEEVIKEAYKNNAKSIHADVNGWMKYGQHHPDEFEFDKDEVERYGNMDSWRPISLQGIETNNGWISINSEKDLPSEDCYCEIALLGGDQAFDRYFANNKNFLQTHYTHLTHYKIVTFSQPPLHKYKSDCDNNVVIKKK